MAKFKRPKNPLAYLNHLMPRGYNTYFTRRGIGCMIRCSFCPAIPPEYLTGYQRWRWLAAHMAMFHHGKAKPALPQIGAAHGAERSQEGKANGRLAA